MAAVGTSSTDFLFGDDIDAIFEALEEDEEFEDYLEVVVSPLLTLIKVVSPTLINRNILWR